MLPAVTALIQPPERPPSPPRPQTWLSDNLDPNLKFEGEKVRILSRGDDWYLDELSLKAEEVFNIIDESVHKRELYVEDRLGIELEVEKHPCGTNWAELNDLTRNYFSSNTDIYDILAGHSTWVTQLTTEDIMWDLREVDNLEMTQPWYSQSFVELSSINDKTFFITGDAALSLSRFAFVTFINLGLAQTYGVENIYKVVDDKQWTIDYLYDAVVNVYDDLNANLTKDTGDLIGFATSNVTGSDLWWSSFDMDMLAKNDAGQLEVVIDHDKVQSALEKVNDLFYTNPGAYVVPSISGDGEYEIMMTAFSSDQYLFTNLRLIAVESEQFINMENLYGILPTPMWDSDQESYQTYVHDQYTAFGLIGTVPEDKLPMMGAFFEAFSCYSYNETREVYFETALKGRYARDEESRRMLDIIIDSIHIDAGWIYNAALEEFPVQFRNLVRNKNVNWSSTWRGWSKMLDHYLKQLNENYG